MSSGRIGKFIVSTTEISALPVLNFPGRIKLVDLSSTTVDDEAHIRDLLGLSSPDKQHSSVIGFDTETKPKSLYSKKRNRTALIQLASDNVCVMYRTLGQSSLPPSLSSILRDDRILKVGQGIEMDARDLREDFGSSVELKGCVDLYKLATHLQCQPKSLQGLVAMFLKHRLLKDMRISDWEAETLRAEQIQYAAIDAWAARCVFFKMVQDGIDVEKIGKVILPEPVQAIPNVSRPANFSTQTAADKTIPFKSSQAELVDLCVRNGYFLKLCGFEKVSLNKFKCKFQVSVGGNTENIFIAESMNGHTSIRAAQEDAAKVMLDRLLLNDDKISSTVS